MQVSRNQESERLSNSGGQAGFSLLEALVSVALVSTVLLALSAGLLASVRSSRSANETQKIDAALSAYSETVKATPLEECPTVSTLPAVPAIGDYTAEITKTQWWDSGPGEWVPCAGLPAVEIPPYRSTVTVTDNTDSSSFVVGQVVVGQP